MKTSEVLRRVREHLGDGHDIAMPTHKRYICYALAYLYSEVKVISDRDRARVKKRIEMHLDGYVTLENWLDCWHNIPLTNTKPYRIKIMATRKAWLTHLIEHYEAKGD